MEGGRKVPLEPGQEVEPDVVVCAGLLDGRNARAWMLSIFQPYLPGKIHWGREIKLSEHRLIFVHLTWPGEVFFEATESAQQVGPDDEIGGAWSRCSTDRIEFDKRFRWLDYSVLTMTRRDRYVFAARPRIP